MPATYKPIATNTVSGSSTTTVTFSSIPSTYTDLILISNCNNSAGDSLLNMQFNGDTATSYSSTRLSGSGSVATTTTTASLSYVLAGRSSSSSYIDGVSIAHIQSYGNTNAYKSVITRSNNSASITGIYLGMWRQTSPITSILIYANNAANFAAGSTFTLYGIKAA